MTVRHADHHYAPVFKQSWLRQPASWMWLLALLCHHLVCDHVTLELIMEEVRALVPTDSPAEPEG